MYQTIDGNIKYKAKGVKKSNLNEDFFKIL